MTPWPPRAAKAAFVPLSQAVVIARPALEDDAVPLPPPPPPPPPDLDALREEAHRAGYAVAAAEAKARIAELEAQLLVARQLGAGLSDARPTALRRAGDDLAALVLATAERVIGDALALNPDALGTVVNRALQRLPDEDEVFVRVPPDAVERVQQVIPERRKATVVADPTVHAGCVVETRYASVETTLRSIMDGLTEATRAWQAGSR